MDDADSGMTASRIWSLQMKRYTLVFAMAWTMLIVGFGAWFQNHEKQKQRKLILGEANTHLLKDQTLRLWAAGHGGIYVPITDHTPPNPYLSHVPEQNIETAAGKQLTLMNPAYVIRQLMEDFDELYGVKGHITSLKPLRPGNAPDKWEQAALESFAQGAREVSEYTEMDGEPYFRLMRPMVVEASCLKCHGHQNYQVGDIRGGIGVAIPTAPFFAQAHDEVISHGIGLGILWLVGLGGLIVGANRISARKREHSRAEAECDNTHTFMQTVIDGIPESLMVINRDYTVALANRTARDMARATNLSTTCLKCHEISHRSAEPCSGTDDPCPLQMVVETRAPVTIEHTHYDTSGQPFPVEIVAAPIFDHQGEVIQIIESCRDITEHNRSANQALQQSEKRYRNIFGNALVGLFRSRLSDGLFLEMNAKAAQLLGLPVDKIVGKISAVDLYRNPDQREELISLLERDGEANGFEVDMKLPDGRDATFEISVKAYPREEYMEGAVIDITSQKLAEERNVANLLALKNMEKINQTVQQATDMDQMLSEVLEILLDMFDVERAWLLYPCDPEAETWSVPMERTRAEYAGAHEDAEEIEMTPEVSRAFRQALDNDDVITVDYRDPGTAQQTAKQFSMLSEMHIALHPPSGRSWLFGLHQCSRQREWKEEEIELFRAISRRLSDALGSLLSLRDLQSSEERFRSLTMSSPDHIMLLDCDGTIRFINYTVPDLTVEQVLGTSILNYMPEKCHQPAMDCFKRVMESRQPDMYLTDYHASDGTVQYFETRVAPVLDKDQIVALIASSHDITQRVQAEEDKRALELQLLRAQKLESLGILAGGIAHDFNNLLMAIMGNADLALGSISSVSPARVNLQEIGIASQRAAGLAQQMLAYSGRGRFSIEQINAMDLLDELTQLLEVSISKNIELRCNCIDDPTIFSGDRTQIHQIIMNMILNAAEAIGDESGVITLTTGTMTCSRSYLDSIHNNVYTALDEPLTEGPYAYIEVADSGCGMDQETIDKIFDPFFTTKFTGRGLGMSAVLGILRGHKATIHINSEIGKGSTFRILVPADNPSENTTDKHDEEPEAKTNERRCDVVLVVDDEETVRIVCKQMLESLGYNVMCAEDGVEAIEIYREHHEKIGCVLLDLTMPHMDGVATFHEMQRIESDVAVILSSGYSEHDATQRFRGSGLSGFIQKPFDTALLNSKLQDSMNSSTSGQGKCSPSG